MEGSVRLLMIRLSGATIAAFHFVYNLIFLRFSRFTNQTKVSKKGKVLPRSMNASPLEFIFFALFFLKDFVAISYRNDKLLFSAGFKIKK